MPTRSSRSALLQVLFTMSLAVAAAATPARDLTPHDTTPGQRTRAEVRAELDKARAEGAMDHFGEATPHAELRADPRASATTREQVLADLARARRAGTLVSGEASPTVAESPAPQRSRAEVRAEAMVASREGLMALWYVAP